jgi:hypothetical protein
MMEAGCFDSPLLPRCQTAGQHIDDGVPTGRWVVLKLVNQSEINGRFVITVVISPIWAIEHRAQGRFPFGWDRLVLGQWLSKGF